MVASRFVQPIEYAGSYPDNWAGYVFKDVLGYTSGIHTGVDYNGPGAGDADLGMPVVAIADGVVKYVGNRAAEGFGNVVILEHPLPDVWAEQLGTDKLYSRYLHLLDWSVAVGQTVSVGQQIARIGKSNTQWAHLHLDLWKADLGIHFRYDKDTDLASYLDPFRFIEGHKQEEEGMKADIGMVKQMAQTVGGRIGMGGRPWTEGEDLPAHVGKDAGQEFLDWYWSEEGIAYRDTWLPAVIGFWQSYNDKVGELQARPSKQELDQLVKDMRLQATAVQAATDKLNKVAAERDALKAEQVESQRIGSAFIQWIGSLFKSK